MISNPAKFFVTGNDEETFTYEGGKNLWHFSPKMSGLSSSMEMNIILFADNHKHALQIIEDMLIFGLSCHIKYLQSQGLLEEQTRRGQYKKNYYKKLLEAKDKWIVIPVKKNQVFKVSWASNDTI